MRKRYQKGSVKKQRGRWVAMWWVDGKRRSKTVGLVTKLSKSDARVMVDRIVAELNRKRQEKSIWRFGEFVEQIYFPFYKRRWKRSTAENNVNRTMNHLVASLGDRELGAVRRDELQDLLDQKAQGGLSFSVVDHLRWDLKQVFDLAVAEGLVERNPALLLFTSREALRPTRRVMTLEEVQKCFSVLEQRERLIVKFAVLAGMRPGEIFGLTWGRLSETYADVVQRVYRGVVDTPKTMQSVRKAALSQGLLSEIEAWREFTIDFRPGAWVFPSERLTPLSKDNCWRRHIAPKLAAVGLEWANFLVMRRTHSSLMNGLGIDGKLVADQLGHSLDVNQNVYTQSAVELRRAAVDQLEQSLQIM